MKAEIALLGLLQGFTEFLPVSSSGHLAIAKSLWGVGEANLSYDLVLHVATLGAVILYFARDILTLLLEWLYGFINRNAHTWMGWRFGWAVVLGTAITGPFGILLKNYVEAASGNLLWLGANFWLTAILLFSSRFMRVKERKVRIEDGLVVGLFQGLAVMPGISRSGATICAGLLAGLSREEAFRFSFLLSIPAILGATLLESRDLGGSQAFLAALPEGWQFGAVAAFASGLLALVLLKRLVTGDRWWLFALYCAAVGSVSIITSLVGG